MRKDMKDRKDMRGTKHTYCNGCFFILLLLKVIQTGDISTFNNLFTLFINMKIKYKTICSIHTLKERIIIYIEE